MRDTVLPRRRMSWVGLAGLVAFWATLGGVVDALVVRDVTYGTKWLAARYVATSGLLWMLLALPVCLPVAALIGRWVGGGEEARGRRAAALAAQGCAILVPWTLVVLLHVHKRLLPPWVPVTSAQGLLVSFLVVAGAVALGVSASFLALRVCPFDGRPLSTVGWGLASIAILLVVVGSPRSDAVADRPNLLLISIDSLRRDVFEEYVENHASPALRRFVAGSRRYWNGHTTFSHSLPSHASMFTGLYPPEHGALITRKDRRTLGSPLGEDVRTVAEVLRDEGYETFAVLANAWIGSPFGLEAGFDTYVNYGSVARVGHFDLGIALTASMAGPYVRYLDRRLVGKLHPNSRLFLRWLERRDRARPFFAFLHYIEMHTPNDPTEAYRAPFVDGRFADVGGTEILYMVEDGELPQSDMPEVWRHLRNLHFGDLARMDEFVSPVLEELMDGGWLENTLVFLVSDHGENLYEKAGTYAKSHVYHTSSEVPFLLHVPGDEQGSDRDDLVSLVDVAATCYAFAGMSAPGELSGVDLLAGNGSARSSTDWIYLGGWDVPHREKARAVLFGDGRKWLRAGEQRDEFYDLASDPHEDHDLSAESRSADAYRRRFDDLIARMAEDDSRPFEVEDLPEEVQDRLRALGYLE